MGKLVLCGTAAIALAIATIPAGAEHHTGPLRNGNHCWKSSPGGNGGHGWGYWADCPAAQATAVRSTRVRDRNRDPHSDR